MWGGRCRVHFVLECKTLEENRKTQMVKLDEALECKSSWTAPHIK